MRDLDIRRALRTETKHRHRNEPDTLILEELGLCLGIARIDLAVVNGSLHGYEIKSERDTLDRLPGQADIYNQTLDYVTIVIAESHAHKVRMQVPEWWGIWSAIQRGQDIELTCTRGSTRNPRVNPFALAQLLWRDEALRALIHRGLSDGMLSKPRIELWSRLASELTVEDLGNVVRESLKRRVDWLIPASQA
jgi:hypothetical protein